MIRIVVLALALLCPVLAQGRTITVQSGAHEGFARLVLSPGAGRDWSFGRTGDGYALRLDPGGDAFDVSRVHDLIGRDRVTAIWADPSDGALRLAIGCACHALPYELGGGVLVIDIRDGPAPAGSSFEMSTTGIRMPSLRAADAKRPRRRPAGDVAYDWLSARAATPVTATGIPMRPVPDQGLRDGLLYRLAEGATRGVVTLDLPAGGKPGSAPSGSLPQIRVGEDLGLVVLPGGGADDPRTRLTPEGRACLTDDALDLAGWLAYPDAATGLGQVRRGLLKEFDAPDPVALTGAVHYLIAIGFGAEARQLMRAFGDGPGAWTPSDRLLLEALSHAVDGEASPTPHFTAMAGCGSAAALWSAMETTGGDLPAGLNTDAVIRAFSALPPGLRRQLGGDLTARLVAAGDAGAARSLADAMQRAPGDADAATRITNARVDLSLGDDARADETLALVAMENGPDAADALIALAEARAVTGAAMDAGQIALLAALAQEYRATPREDPLRRATVLAMALAGDFDAAFAAVDRATGTKRDLWRLLAVQGPDAALLAHAVVADADVAEAALPDDRRRIAERLAALGLPDTALAWLPEAGDATDADRLVAAAVHLGRRDGLSALRILTGVDDAAALPLRAAAQSALGSPLRAGPLFARLGDTALAAAEARKAGDWAAVAAGQDLAWAAAASLILPARATGGTSGTVSPQGPLVPGTAAAAIAGPGTAMPSGDGPLAQAATLVADAAAARATVMSLLAAVPTPAPIPAPVGPEPARAAPLAPDADLMGTPQP